VFTGFSIQLCLLGESGEANCLSQELQVAVSLNLSVSWRREIVGTCQKSLC